MPSSTTADVGFFDDEPIAALGPPCSPSRLVPFPFLRVSATPFCTEVELASAWKFRRYHLPFFCRQSMVPTFRGHSRRRWCPSPSPRRIPPRAMRSTPTTWSSGTSIASGRRATASRSTTTARGASRAAWSPRPWRGSAPGRTAWATTSGRPRWRSPCGCADATRTGR